MFLYIYNIDEGYGDSMDCLLSMTEDDMRDIKMTDQGITKLIQFIEGI